MFDKSDVYKPFHSFSITFSWNLILEAIYGPACFHNVHSIAATFHYDLSVKSVLTVSGGVRHPRAGFVLHISLQFFASRSVWAVSSTISDNMYVCLWLQHYMNWIVLGNFASVVQMHPSFVLRIIIQNKHISWGGLIIYILIVYE